MEKSIQQGLIKSRKCRAAVYHWSKRTLLHCLLYSSYNYEAEMHKPPERVSTKLLESMVCNPLNDCSVQRVREMSHKVFYGASFRDIGLNDKSHHCHHGKSACTVEMKIQLATTLIDCYRIFQRNSWVPQTGLPETFRLHKTSKSWAERNFSPSSQKPAPLDWQSS